jgi:hydroxyacylglutathione hydrolase
MSINLIPILPMQMLNAYLVEQENGLILFDCGLPQSAARIGRALEKIGRGWSDLSLIILSHGHVDHAGAAAQIQALAPQAPLVAGRAEGDFLAGRAVFDLRPTGMVGRALSRLGLIQRRYLAPRVDHWVDDHLDLTCFGLSGRLIATPGHTPGSIALLLPDGQVLAGDLLASGVLLGGIVLRHRPKSPPFQEDARQVTHALQALLAAGGTLYHPGHGGAIPAKAVRRHVKSLTAKGLAI